ncbi:hypothetical protein Spb1_04950 [Planctopirus ephydatiae]|uniref:Uncharacterized protein n=1 Tax=Planctopirus ephydatiae TaxID=2528019 RepID=A0A518GJ68_9PLAN|nr:hypothetical protein [Planctopirus ephydatiae]QDV28632.1 hypothetical protein Spb1_04950 [Planctopirus ephydatiae]
MTDHSPDIPGLILHDRSLDRVIFSADTQGTTIQGARLTAALLIGGSTLLLGALGIMGAAVGGPGWLVVFGSLWLFVIGFVAPGLLEIERTAASKTIEITGDTVTVKYQLLWGVHTETYPAEYDLVVKWLVVVPTEPRNEPRYHIELVGSYWRIPFGYDWPKDVQAQFVRWLRLQVGQTLRATCPSCQSGLSVRNVDRASGRQHCSNCDWSSRGRQSPMLSTAEGNLLLPPLSAGPLRVELATPEALIVRIGTRLTSWLVLLAMLLVVATFSMCCVAGLLVPARNNPQQAVDIVGSVWVGAIAIGLVVCVVLYWHRHYRQTITLTANRSRQEVEIERSVGGLPIRTWVTLEGGGYVSGEPVPWPWAGLVSGPLRAVTETDPDVQLVDANTHRVHSLGQRLRHSERRWLSVVLNRFLGTPQFSTPDGQPYPETCGLCGRDLSPEQIDTESGVLCCAGFPDCLWSTSVGSHDHEAAEKLAQTQAAIDKVRQQWSEGVKGWGRWQARFRRK